jgi:hypothetical protein
MPFPGGPNDLSPEAKKAATRLSHEALVREALASYTATAIVGNRASLRSNVGNITPTVSTTASTAPQNLPPFMAPPTQQAAPNVGTATARQTVVRVKTNSPFYVAGIELTPTVFETHVEFRMAGQTTVVAYVMLESLSSHGYVPLTTSRELADPLVGARVNPTSSQTIGMSSSMNTANGGATNASGGTQNSQNPPSSFAR